MLAYRVLRARAALLFSVTSAWLGAQMVTLGAVRLQCGDDAGSAWWSALQLSAGAAGGGGAALQPEPLPPQCTAAFLQAACAGSLCAAPLISPCISLYLLLSPVRRLAVRRALGAAHQPSP